MRKEMIIQPDEKVVFNQYLDDFDLKIDDLRDKSILDVGGGMIPKFVEYCLQNNITEKIYTVDYRPFGHDFVYYGHDYDNPVLEHREGTEKLKSKKHYIQADGENIPLKEDVKFDLILMRASLNDESSVIPRVEEALQYLKNGGELRISPVRKDHYLYEKLSEITGRLNKNEFQAEWNGEVVKREPNHPVFLLVIKRI